LESRAKRVTFILNQEKAEKGNESIMMLMLILNVLLHLTADVSAVLTQKAFASLVVKNLIRAKPKAPYESISPECQRMENYYFQQCVTASPGSGLLKVNDPAKYGDRGGGGG